MKPIQMRTKAIYLEQERQPPSLALGRGSKVGMRVRRLHSWGGPGVFRLEAADKQRLQAS